ncbi:hypothetical protein LIER_37167 [Lithospermum erythrorhizon]|uniref:Uncharacterized protein n=1 Tax=Lithospermum erythrorhizon TaxID=34254 RepID=A0AAV3PGC9_LITER
MPLRSAFNSSTCFYKSTLLLPRHHAWSRDSVLDISWCDVTPPGIFFPYRDERSSGHVADVGGYLLFCVGHDYYCSTHHRVDVVRSETWTSRCPDDDVDQVNIDTHSPSMICVKGDYGAN